MSTTVPQLLTVAEARDRLGMTESGIRHRIFHDIDGFASTCVVRSGRCVRIREDRLAQWVDERTGAPPWHQPWEAGRKPKKAGSP